MIVAIILLAAILVGSMLVGRFTVVLAERRLTGEKRDALHALNKGFKRYVILIPVVGTVLFLLGVILFPESFSWLIQLYFVFAMIYVLLVNVLYFINVVRSKPGVLFLVIVLVGRIAALAGITVFCYIAGSLIDEMFTLSYVSGALGILLA